MPGFWRKCRITFRWLRIGAWLLVLALIGAFLWCNRVGLPDFLKAQITSTLHERGVELEFSRMRLSLIHGLVADNVHAGTGRTADNATLTARTVQLQLSFSALWHRRLQLDGLVLRDGYFTLPLSPTNALTLTNLQTELRFGTNDTWLLDHFRADFAGAQISISGELAHAPEAGNWKLFSSRGGGNNTNQEASATALKKFSDALNQIKFSGTPQVKLTLSGDARDLYSLTARFEANATGVQTPWFDAQSFQAGLQLASSTNAPTGHETAWGFWTNLQPFRLGWSVKLAKLRSEKLDVNALDCGGVWAAPGLMVTNLSAELGHGRLTANAMLNVATRQFAFTNNSVFDPHAIAAWLPEKTRAQFGAMTWQQPPLLKLEGTLRLPPWTNTVNDWPEILQSSARLRGELAFTNAVIAGLKVERFQTHFSYADWIYSVTGLALAQGRTQLFLSGEFSAATKNIRGLLTGQMDTASLQPFLTTNVADGLSILTLGEPLALTLDVGGNLRALENLTVAGRVAMTNFAVRGQAMDSVTGRLACTNGVLHLFEPKLMRDHGTQTLTGDDVSLDFKTLVLVISNGFSTADPVVMTAAIGPKTAHLIEPYHFLKNPVARVNGCLPLRNMSNPHDTVGTDLRFDIIQGLPFRWLQLNATSLMGTIRWLGPELVLTNIQGELYSGTGSGSAYFDFRPPHEGADYRFDFTVTNVNLHQFAVDVTTPTNRLEGTLAGQLVVTQADTRTLDSWNGFGMVKLHDGLLWDIPMISILSPVLNTVSAGLGNSRATDAKADYTITNGVIFSDSLQIHSTMMRLSYTGTVDMDQRVNARVTAHLLRDIWVVGPLVSTVLWPVSKVFECKVTGTLDDPQPTPIYFPKILLAPLHPIKTIEGLFSPSANTNAPATK